MPLSNQILTILHFIWAESHIQIKMSSQSSTKAISSLHKADYFWKDCCCTNTQMLLLLSLSRNFLSEGGFHSCSHIPCRIKGGNHPSMKPQAQSFCRYMGIRLINIWVCTLTGTTVSFFSTVFSHDPFSVGHLWFFHRISTFQGSLCFLHFWWSCRMRKIFRPWYLIQFTVIKEVYITS